MQGFTSEIHPQVPAATAVRAPAFKTPDIDEPGDNRINLIARFGAGF
jgi:hypothetical protein